MAERLKLLGGDGVASLTVVLCFAALCTGGLDLEHGLIIVAERLAVGLNLALTAGADVLDPAGREAVGLREHLGLGIIVGVKLCGEALAYKGDTLSKGGHIR